MRRGPGGGSRPLHLRPVDTICFKLNKIGLQNDGDRHNTLPLLTMKSQVKSNLCQGINIYRAINAYKPNSTMIKFNSALSRRGQARSKLCPACHYLVLLATSAARAAFGNTVVVTQKCTKISKVILTESLYFSLKLSEED